MNQRNSGTQQSSNSSRSRSRSPKKITGSKSGAREVGSVSVLRVSGLTGNVRNAHLKEIFGEYGEVESAECIIDPHRKTHFGVALVVFKTLQGAQQALKYLDGGQLDSQVMAVCLHDGKPIPLPPPPPPPIKPISAEENQTTPTESTSGKKKKKKKKKKNSLLKHNIDKQTVRVKN
eukprot:TRINITY_DN7856_c0_g1_i2.p1 TRINITY_DN7856_c0_g1~~TRINITY_DN7856_c0_g1_i2.p1  ORF type:complete len:176 (-),score=29.91 TRINITY_DN7856_c0_g1_i2:100-627(-)